MLLSSQTTLDSSGLGTAGPTVLVNTLLLLSSQPHPTGTAWNDKEPSQAMVHGEGFTKRQGTGLPREEQGWNPGVLGIFPLSS